MSDFIAYADRNGKQRAEVIEVKPITKLHLKVQDVISTNKHR